MGRLVTAGEFGIDFKRMKHKCVYTHSYVINLQHFYSETEATQREVFETLLGVIKDAAPELPLQLHVRNEGSFNRRADNVALECMRNVEKESACNERTVAQANMLREPHHRHCFTGNVQAMQEWQRVAPNAYFGFTNAVRVTGKRKEKTFSKGLDPRLWTFTQCRQGAHA